MKNITSQPNNIMTDTGNTVALDNICMKYLIFQKFHMFFTDLMHSKYVNNTLSWNCHCKVAIKHEIQDKCLKYLQFPRFIILLQILCISIRFIMTKEYYNSAFITLSYIRICINSCLRPNHNICMKYLIFPRYLVFF